MNRNLLRNGLIAAGAANIGGVLLFSRFFTNHAINAADPIVMSNFGLLMIVVWGLAYISAAPISSNYQWLMGVFAFEKLIYFTAWVFWHTSNSITLLYAKDLFAGVFFSIYGLIDFVFMIFFFWAAKAKPRDA